MRFNLKVLLLTLSALASGSCSNGSGGYGDTKLPTVTKPEIGAPLRTYFPLAAAGSGFPTDIDQDNPDVVYLQDRRVSRIHRINLGSLTMEASYLVAPVGDHFVLPGPQGAFLLDVADGSIEIIKEDGSRLQDPLSLQGKPVSGTYKRDEGIYVIVDDLNSVGILKLSPTGDVLATFVGGTKFGSKEGVISGDLFADQRLVFMLSDRSMITIDLEATFTAGAWSFASSEPFATQHKVLARSTWNPDWALAISDSGAHAIDISNAKINEDLLDLGSLLGWFRGDEPHAYFRDDEGKVFLIALNANGGLTKELITKSFDGVCMSIYNPSDATLTLLTGHATDFGLTSIYRLRITDGLVMAEHTESDHVRVGVTNQHMIIQFDSTLGMLKRRSFGSKVIQELGAFNLPFLN